jgi:hypothetical protein
MIVAMNCQIEDCWLASFHTRRASRWGSKLGHRRATEKNRTEQRRKGVRCGISRAVSVCIEKARGFDHISTFRLFLDRWQIAHMHWQCCCAFWLGVCTGTPRAVELLEEGDNATNKMDTVHRDQHVACWGSALWACNHELTPTTHPCSIGSM